MAIDLVATLRLKDEMTGNLKKLTGFATVGFAAIGAAAVAATNTFAGIDAELRRTASLSGATAEEFTQLTAAATEMGSNSTKSMQEISQSMSELAANGMSAQQVMAAMPGIIKASEASGESLAVAASTVSAALNTWNLEATESGKVADILTMAANVSAAGIDDMSYALKYAGAPAAALGMDLAEVSAAIGAMVDSGIDGSSAGTSLRAALLALNNPAKAQEKVMKNLGFSITDTSGEAKSLVDIISNMTEATKHMTAADRLATIGKLVGTEAVSGFLALMNRGPAELSKMTDALRSSDGIAKETADNMNQGVGALINGIKSKFEAFSFSVGQALEPVAMQVLGMVNSFDFTPIVDGAKEVASVMVDVVSSVINNWDEIIGTVKLTSTTILAAVAAVTTFKAAMAGMAAMGIVIQLFNAWRAGTLLATAATLGFNTAMWASPVTWVAAGIAALVGAAVLLALNWETVTTKTRELWSAIGGLEGALRLITGPIGILIGAAIDLATNWDSTKGVWENVWGAMKRSAAETVNSVIGGINKMIETINMIPGVNIPIIAKVSWGGNESFNTAAKVVNSSGTQALGYYHGLDNVPYDNMPARLHRNEMVLTATEAKAYREGNGSGGKSNAPVINIAKMEVRKESDIEKVAMQLAKLIEVERNQVQLT